MKNKLKTIHNSPAIFNTTSDDMHSLELSIVDLNNFTKKIDAIIFVEDLGYSKDGIFFDELD